MKIVITDKTPQEAADVARREWMKSDKRSKVVVIDYGNLDDYLERGKFNIKSFRSTIRKRFRLVMRQDADVVIVPIASLGDDAVDAIERLMNELDEECEAELINEKKLDRDV